MRRLILLAAALFCLAAPASAQAAEFGLKSFDVTYLNEDGSPDLQAGSHPYALKVTFAANTEIVPEGGPCHPEIKGTECEFPVDSTKDLEVEQITGFAGNPTAVPPCSALDFLSKRSGSLPECSDGSAIGVVLVDVGTGETHGTFESPVYELKANAGAAATLGFWVQGVPVTVDAGVSEEEPFNVIAHTRGVSQVLEFYGAELTLWGNPASPVHDEDRGTCGSSTDTPPSPKCPAGVGEKPFLTLPRACTGPLPTFYATDSWQNPGSYLPNGAPNLEDPNWVTGFSLTHDGATPPNPTGFGGCGKLGFSPEMSATPSTTSAESAAGIDVSIDVSDEGLTSTEGIANSDIRAITTAFPPGVTLNPSAAEGLGVCTRSQYEEASLTVGGCPDAAKIGSVEIETPILEEKVIRGSVYLAQQDDPATTEEGAENPFDSLLAIYFLVRDPGLGLFVKQAGEVETNESTGQVFSRFEDIPQFPLSHIGVHLRSGPRAPLVTPPTCGSYETTAEMTPWSGGEPLLATSSFTITSGVGGAPCPPATPPFNPGFEAGAVNNAAGQYSPFDMRITRADGEADLTRFSAILPPGVTGKIAGISKCPDAAIAGAKLNSGRQELASPSCPANSLVGHVLGGAGVGADLTYVPGSLYLAGPFGGDPLSIVSIVPAVAGPFDVGTVVTRVALTLNPLTAEVEVDGAASDPIPHLLKGIPLKLRDLRVFTDRPNFTLNATSCTEKLAKATLTGSGANPFSPADDVPVPKSARYQAASCASLAFKPKLALSLKGGTKRGDHPAFKAVLTPKAGDANLAKAVTLLPHTLFIDQNHINNPCTRVQFNANQCPPGSVLGTAIATSPLLEEPLEGPIYFRSNGGERELPDVVLDLHGLFHIIQVGFVDSKNARIRTTFASVPDAPITKVTLSLKGGKKGLLVNSANLCAHKQRASFALTGQNGRKAKSEPVLKTSCKGKRVRRAGRR